MSRAIDLLLFHVTKCPRCDGSHPVDMKRFAKPLPVVRVGDPAAPLAAQEMRFTYWGLCPTTREPILMTSAIEPHLTRAIACAR